MKQVSVTELEKQLSRYLRLVKRGEVVEILERSIPVARLVGIRVAAAEGHLERLQRDGIVIPAKRRPHPLQEPPAPCRGDAGRAVVDERGDR